LSDCGKCSGCKSKTKTKTDYVAAVDAITHLLIKEEMSSRALQRATNFSEDQLIDVLQLMLEKNLISISDHNTYKLITYDN